MGTYCSGSIEVQVCDPDQVDPHGMWSEVINIAPITDKNYRMFCLLFGVRCADCDPASITPIAAGRGLPPATTFTGRGKEFFSWATTEEFEQAYKVVEGAATSWGWNYLLDSMKLFASKMGSHRVRIVVGFW